MARRVYEYVDQDGNVFYSFSRLPMVSVARRMTLQTRVGVHFQNFLSYFRELALGEDPEEG